MLMKRGETSNVFLAPFVFEKSLKVACASRLHCYLLTIFSCHRGVGCGLGVTLGVGVAVGGGVSVSVGVTVGVTVGGVGVIEGVGVGVGVGVTVGVTVGVGVLGGVGVGHGIGAQPTIPIVSTRQPSLDPLVSLAIRQRSLLIAGRVTGRVTTVVMKPCELPLQA